MSVQVVHSFVRLLPKLVGLSLGSLQPALKKSLLTIFFDSTSLALVSFVKLHLNCNKIEEISVIELII